MLKDQESIVTR